MSHRSLVIADFLFGTVLLVLLFAGPAMAEPIEWKVTGGGNDLNYGLLRTRGNSLLIGENVAAGAEGLLGITEHLTTIAAGSERDFLIETAAGDALLGAIIEWITVSPVDTSAGRMEQLRQQLRPAPQLSGRIGTSRR
jgi:hypothetical protein